jgi:hypothetical protein
MDAHQLRHTDRASLRLAAGLVECEGRDVSLPVIGAVAALVVGSRLRLVEVMGAAAESCGVCVGVGDFARRSIRGRNGRREAGVQKSWQRFGGLGMFRQPGSSGS